MAVMKELFYFNHSINESYVDDLQIEEPKQKHALTFEVYIKKHCLFLIADILKLEKNYKLNLQHILKKALIFCFEKEIKKPRAIYVKNKIKLYSEKYNYTISLKYYFL